MARSNTRNGISFWCVLCMQDVEEHPSHCPLHARSIPAIPQPLPTTCKGRPSHPLATARYVPGASRPSPATIHYVPGASRPSPSHCPLHARGIPAIQNVSRHCQIAPVEKHCLTSDTKAYPQVLLQ